MLEDPGVQARARSDPRRLLESLRLPVLLDEIQKMPELLASIRTRIDESPAKKGQWLLNGSPEALRIQGVTESMAGRAAILHLLPLSLLETDRVSLPGGGYPEALARPRARDRWFSSYVQTYPERDVRAVVNVRDLATFRRFLSLPAGRYGQILNRTDLAAPLGVSVPAISVWLHVLEFHGQILLVPPCYENFGKHLLKSPRVDLLDSGLACHLFGIRTQAELARPPFLGPLFEGFVAAEILKQQANRGRRRGSSTSSGTGRGLRLISCFRMNPAACGWWSARHRTRFSRQWRGLCNRCAASWGGTSQCAQPSSIPALQLLCP